MAILNIPLPSDTPFFTLRTIFSNREYLFTFRWNQRAGYFSFDLDDGEGERIVSGVRFIVDAILNKNWTDERAPFGLLLAMDTTGEGRPPTLADMGSRVQLLFVPAGEPAPS